MTKWGGNKWVEEQEEVREIKMIGGGKLVVKNTQSVMRTPGTSKQLSMRELIQEKLDEESDSDDE